MQRDFQRDYDRAIQLVQYHAQILWWSFGTFLLAETVILGFLGNMLANASPTCPDQYALVFWGSVIGLFLAIPWYGTFRYTHTQYLLRVERARQLERHTGSPFFKDGHDFSEKRYFEVTDLGDPKKTKKIPPLYDRFVFLLFPPRKSFVVFIIVFAVAFGYLAWRAGPPW